MKLWEKEQKEAPNRDWLTAAEIRLLVEGADPNLRRVAFPMLEVVKHIRWRTGLDLKSAHGLVQKFLTEWSTRSYDIEGREIRRFFDSEIVEWATTPGNG